MVGTAVLSFNATLMRGGTSKGLFVAFDDLPAAARAPGPARDRVLLRAMGSPDPYRLQIDGLGGATPSTSKVVLVGRSSRPGFDLEYLFGAVAIDQASIDWSGNCGNLSAAVGPFALARGLVERPDGCATLRLWQANIGQTIVARVPVRGGLAEEGGEFELDGVAFPAAEISLEFLDPGADPESGGGALFPTGRVLDTLQLPGVGAVETTLITAGAPTVFVDAARFGFTGTESQAQLDSDVDACRALITVRAHAAAAMALVGSPGEAERSPNAPRIAWVAPPASYEATGGKHIAAADIELLVRMLSLGRLHASITGTGAVALAVAAAVPGTLIARVLRDGARPSLRLGHPSGTLRVGAEVKCRAGAWSATAVRMSRSARRLMQGQAFVPAV